MTGAGFGVLATEAVVLRLCDGQPPALEVRVDALLAVASEPGPIGTALAATIIGAMAKSVPPPDPSGWSEQFWQR